MARTRKQKRARRATVYRDAAGKFRYRVQGGNWQIIDDPEQGFARKITVIERLGAAWPDVEELVDVS